MRILVAPDKFKGSLSASQVAARVAAGLTAVAPGAVVVQIPVADGGEGTVEAAVAGGFRRVPVEVAGPTGQLVRAALDLEPDVARCIRQAGQLLERLAGRIAVEGLAVRTHGRPGPCRPDPCRPAP